MKKVLPFIILLMFFSVVVFIIARSSEQDFEVEYVSELNPNRQEIIRVCVKNKDDKLVLINALKHNDENMYTYVLKLYDHYRNNLPLSYKTPLNGNFEVNKVVRDKNTLNIDLSMLYLDSGLNEFLNALIWSYQDFGIEKINANINGHLFVVEKDASINPVMESTNIYNNKKQIIFYENEEEIIPVTYYHNENKLNFLMNKIASKYQGINYDIQIVDKFISISIEDKEEILSKSVINLIILSIKQMGEFDEIVIIVNNEDIYNN